jgi:signal transduction histidine kinase
LILTHFQSYSKSAIASETGGNGLGLFVSKSIIEAHGGNIWAENNSDGKKGRRFTLVYRYADRLTTIRLYAHILISTR